MLFNVPQYIDVEDKVAGPLTAKQLMWMIAMGAVLTVLWGMFNKGMFFAFAIPIVCIFVALAFYRPYGQPLASFIGSAFLFVIRPKVYMWSRPTKVSSVKTEKRSVESPVSQSKKISVQEIERLAKIVDSQK